MACAVPHTKEVYPADGAACDADSLVAYLGGDPGVDLLGEGLAVSPTDGDGSRCTVTTGTGADLPSQSLKGLWEERARSGYKEGGQFRQCLNHQGRAVSCDAEHSAEVIYKGNQDMDCNEAYQRFVGRDAGEDSRDIKVTRSTVDTSVVCRAEVRVVEDSLSASLRGLGRTALPIRH